MDDDGPSVIRGTTPKWPHLSIRLVNSHIYLNLASLSSSWWGTQWKAVYQPGSARERRQDSWCAVVQWGGTSYVGSSKSGGWAQYTNGGMGSKNCHWTFGKKVLTNQSFFLGFPMFRQTHGCSATWILSSLGAGYGAQCSSRGVHETNAGEMACMMLTWIKHEGNSVCALASRGALI